MPARGGRGPGRGPVPPESACLLERWAAHVVTRCTRFVWSRTSRAPGPSEGASPPPGSAAAPVARRSCPWPRHDTGRPGPTISSAYTRRAAGSSTRAPTRAWCRPPWPSAGSTAPARTACWPGTPTAPGAQPRRPAWPCTRPTAPAGTRRGSGCRTQPTPHGACVYSVPLSCSTLIQDMSGDASACPGKLLLPPSLRERPVSYPCHGARALWHFAHRLFPLRAEVRGLLATA